MDSPKTTLILIECLPLPTGVFFVEPERVPNKKTFVKFSRHRATHEALLGSLATINQVIKFPNLAACCPPLVNLTVPLQVF